MSTKPYAVEKTPEQWREQLSATQYAVLREKGTERAFTGQYSDHNEAGRYASAGCGGALLDSPAKFDSGWGGPGF